MHPPMHPIDASGERSPDSSLSGGGETALPPLLFFFQVNCIAMEHESRRPRVRVKGGYGYSPVTGENE